MEKGKVKKEKLKSKGEKFKETGKKLNFSIYNFTFKFPMEV